MVSKVMDSRLVNAAKALPVFPLPRTVLMPGMLLPLHVFEPRYRALVEHCLGSDKLMGICTLRGRDSTEIYPVIGIGELVAHQPFEDGRSNIVLQYLGSAKLTEELAVSTPFRQLVVDPVPFEMAGGKSAIARLRQLVLQLGMISSSVGEEAARVVSLDDEDMVDLLARKALEETEERLAYLGARSLPERVRHVEVALAKYLHVPGSTTMH